MLLSYSFLLVPIKTHATFFMIVVLLDPKRVKETAVASKQGNNNPLSAVV